MPTAVSQRSIRSTTSSRSKTAPRGACLGVWRLWSYRPALAGCGSGEEAVADPDGAEVDLPRGGDDEGVLTRDDRVAKDDVLVDC